MKTSKKKQNGKQLVEVKLGAGPVNLEARFPMPRLPSWLGAANRLAANAAVYPRVDLDFPIVLQNVLVTAGGSNTVVALDPSVLISGWSSRIQNLFREFCVVGARFELTLTSATNPAGCVLVFVDETLATAPNTGSLYVPHMEIPIVSSPNGMNTQLVSYMPSGSYTDLDWIPCAAPTSKQWLKFYAAAVTGTGGTTTATILLRGTIAMAFRGFANF